MVNKSSTTQAQRFLDILLEVGYTRDEMVEMINHLGFSEEDLETVGKISDQDLADFIHGKVNGNNGIDTAMILRIYPQVVEIDQDTELDQEEEGEEEIEVEAAKPPKAKKVKEAKATSPKQEDHDAKILIDMKAVRAAVRALGVKATKDAGDTQTLELVSPKGRANLHCIWNIEGPFKAQLQWTIPGELTGNDNKALYPKLKELLFPAG